MGMKPSTKVKITSEDQPCRHCGSPLRRKVRGDTPKKARKSGYYYLWWFVCTNRGCRALYMIEDAKRLQSEPFAPAPPAPVVEVPVAQDSDAYDTTSAKVFLRPGASLLLGALPSGKTSKSERKRLRREAKERRRTEKRKRKQERRVQLPAWRVAYLEYIDSPEWRAFRMTVFATRGRTCQRCGAEKGTLHIHHLHYRNLLHEKLEDVQVLCEDCHCAAHPEKNKVA